MCRINVTLLVLSVVVWQTHLNLITSHYSQALYLMLQESESSVRAGRRRLAGETGREEEMLDKQKEKEKKESIFARRTEADWAPVICFFSQLPIAVGAVWRRGCFRGWAREEAFQLTFIREKFEPTQAYILLTPLLCQLILLVNLLLN